MYKHIYEVGAMEFRTWKLRTTLLVRNNVTLLWKSICKSTCRHSLVIHFGRPTFSSTSDSRPAFHPRNRNDQTTWELQRIRSAAAQCGRGMNRDAANHNESQAQMISTTTANDS